MAPSLIVEACMNDSNGTERRREPRRRTLKAGRLLIDKKAVLNCTIRNLSQHGGRLDIDSIVGVPEEFVLDIAGEGARPARTVWKSHSSLGVKLG
jgi:hypothetical protein